MHVRTTLRLTLFLCCLTALLVAQPVFAQEGTLYVKNDKVGIGTSDPEFGLHLRRADGQGAGFKVETTNAPQNFSWFFQQNASTGAFLVTPFEGGGAPLQIFPGDISVIPSTMVLRNGRAGVGTQNPEAKLHVIGQIKQNSKVIHPDFVFEPDYQLESISDHAAYMWSNRHLPAIGAGQYDDNGDAVIEFGARSQGMLEELEKAHIYIEQLDLRLNELQARMDSQETRVQEKDDEIVSLKAEIETLKAGDS